MPQNNAEETNSKKSEKQMKNIAERVIARYKSLSFVSVGVASVGFVAALLCNFAFLRANIGFYIALIFYIAAAVVQSILTVNSKSAVSSDEFDGTAVKGRINTVCMAVIMYICALFAAVLPLITLTADVYFGILAEDFFRKLFRYLRVVIVLSLVMFALRFRKRLDLKKVMICLVIIAVTAAAQSGANAYLKAGREHFTYNNVQDFISFMEAEQPDKYGEPEPYSMPDWIEVDGKRYDFVNRNQSVSQTLINEDGSIYVYTEEHMRLYMQKKQTSDLIFMLLYAAELIAGTWYVGKNLKA